MDRERVRNSLLMAVDEQLLNNKPPEVKQTLDRLMSEGWSKDDSKGFIAHCLALEIFEIGKFSKPYDNDRYIKNLSNLPELPDEEDYTQANDYDENQDLPSGVKIGRNEKVTVKYLDGRIEENIKFKKVKNDLLNGFCELVE